MKEDLSFKSLKEEREFWEAHNPFEELEEKDWKITEEGIITVRSIYTASVGKKGAFVYFPKEVLSEIDIKRGRRIRAWKDGKRLMVKAV